MRRILVILAVLVVLAAVVAPTIWNVAAAQPEEARFPATLVDIDGARIDVAEVARTRNLVVVTLKAAWCPVCARQLVRLRERLDELRRCDVTFLVLAPGKPAQLERVRSSTGFDFPFVADEGLEVAESLGLVMAPDQIFPCMFRVEPDLEIGWRQLGRNGAYFGDGALADYFDCTSI